MRMTLLILALAACAPDPQGPNFSRSAPATGSIRVEVCPDTLAHPDQSPACYAAWRALR